MATTPVRFRKVRKQDVNAVSPPYVLHRANDGCDWIMGRLIGRHSGKSDRQSCWLVEHWCGTLTQCTNETILIMEPQPSGIAPDSDGLVEKIAHEIEQIAW